MSPHPSRSWRHKFTDAFRGMWLAVRRDRSFRVHLIAAGGVVIAAIGLRCDLIEWCLLVGCIGAVFAVETVNSSIETLFHALDDATKARMTGCLDRAAGAVLIASITAVVIGVLILGRRAATAFGWM
jgi:diacylglycerol kinase